MPIGRDARRRIPALALATVVVLTAGAAVGGAAAGRDHGGGADTSSHVQPWLQDLDALVQGLSTSSDPTAYGAGKAAFLRDIAKLRAEAGTATDDQMTVGIMQAVASFGVGHEDVQQQAPRYYPLALYLFGNGFHVIEARPAFRDLLGATLTEIGSTPIATAYRDVATTYAAENQYGLAAGAPDALVDADLLDGLGILRPGAGDFTFRLTDGRTVRVSLPAETVAQWQSQGWTPAYRDPPLYQQNRDEDFWFSYLPASQTMYIRYTVCQDPAGFAAMTRKVFALAATVPIRRFVVDLRGNTGGDSDVIQPLLTALSTSQLPREGRLYAVTDRATYSSGLEAAVSLVAEHAVLVGEPSGEDLQTYGEAGTFALPNSGLAVQYATQHYDFSRAGAEILTPSIPITPTFAQYAAGDDPVMDRIEALP